MNKLLLWFFLIIFLYGCSLSPKLTIPKQNLPNPKETGIEIKKGWWKDFKDPSLNSIIIKVLKNNDDIRLAYEKLKEFKIRYELAISNQFPIVTAQGGAMRIKPSRTTYPSTIYNYYSLQGNFSFDTDMFGKLKSATKVSFENMIGKKYYVELIKLKLITDVLSSYLNLCSLNEQIKNTEEMILTQKSIVNVLENLEKNGLVDPQEIDSEKMTLTQFISTLENLKKIKKAINSNILFLMGEEPRGIFAGNIECKKLPKPIKIPSFLPTKVLTERPDILMSLANLKAANFNIGVAKANLFPNISITANGGYESEQFHKLIEPGAKFWNIALNLFTPIFEFGRLKKAVKLAQIQKKEAALSYVKTVKQAFLDVHNSLTKLNAQKNLLKEAENNLKYSKNIYTIMKMKYNNGLLNTLELLRSKENLLEAQDSLIIEKLKYLQNEVDFYHALGGKW